MFEKFESKKYETKSVVVGDNGYAILVTDVPNHIDREELEEIAYFERRFAEQQLYENLEKQCWRAREIGDVEEPEDFGYWDDFSLPLPIPDLYIENPVLIANYDKFYDMKDTVKNAVYLGGIQSIVRYKDFDNDGEDDDYA